MNILFLTLTSTSLSYALSFLERSSSSPLDKFGRAMERETSQLFGTTLYALFSEYQGKFVLKTLKAKKPQKATFFDSYNYEDLAMKTGRFTLLLKRPQKDT